MAEKAYAEVERALDWYYQAREATLGIRAQSYEPSSTLEWDDERCWRLHAAHVDNWHHGEALRRAKEIETQLRTLDRGNVIVLERAFTTGGWSPGLALEFPIRHGRSLVGVALMTEAARKLYEEFGWKPKVEQIDMAFKRVNADGERVYVAAETTPVAHGESLLACFERIRLEVAGERDKRRGELRKQHKIFQPVREQARSIYDIAIDAFARSAPMLEAS